MNKNFPRAVLATSLLCFVMNYFLLARMKEIWWAAQYPFFDFSGQWKLCAYVLRGIDPYPLIGLRTPLIEEIGSIPAAWSTTPWGLVLGNFFYPGFVDVGEAAIYFVALNILFLLWTALAVARNLNFGLGKWKIFFVTLIIFFAHFFISLYFGNAGAVICCLLILCCIFADESPILSGIFLALAMVKPQVALPICFALLLRKNFKVLAVAAVVDFASWGVAALMTNQTSLNLLTEFLSSNAGGKNVFCGLFTMVFPENKSLAMATSMTAGILFIWLTWRLGFKDEKNFWMMPACLSTTFFAYSFHNEYFILVLPALACLDFAFRAEDLHKKFFWLATIFFLATQPYLEFWSITIMNFYSGYEENLSALRLTRTIVAVVIILLGIFMAKKIPTRVGN